jgi:hypothetical protein
VPSALQQVGQEHPIYEYQDQLDVARAMAGLPPLPDEPPVLMTQKSAPATLLHSNSASSTRFRAGTPLRRPEAAEGLLLMAPSPAVFGGSNTVGRFSANHGNERFGAAPPTPYTTISDTPQRPEFGFYPETPHSGGSDGVAMPPRRRSSFEGPSVLSRTTSQETLWEPPRFSGSSLDASRQSSVSSFSEGAQLSGAVMQRRLSALSRQEPPPSPPCSDPPTAGGSPSAVGSVERRRPSWTWAAERGSAPCSPANASGGSAGSRGRTTAKLRELSSLTNRRLAKGKFTPMPLTLSPALAPRSVNSSSDDGGGGGGSVVLGNCRTVVSDPVILQAESWVGTEADTGAIAPSVGIPQIGSFEQSPPTSPQRQHQYTLPTVVVTASPAQTTLFPYGHASQRTSSGSRLAGKFIHEQFL